MAKRLSDIGEFEMIDLIRKTIGVSFRSLPALHSRGVIQGIGDDAAVLPLTKDKYLLFTTDMLVEGVHFTLKNSPSAIGRKAIACNVSDIAAMGGVPTYAVVSLGVSAAARMGFVKNLYQGMSELCRKFRCSIVGGDTVKSDKLIINVALLGEVPKKYLTLRSGARPGDLIFITGALGNSLKSGRHLSFTPRVKEAQYLAKNFHTTAMIDISDGLAGDLGHILAESKVGAVIYEHKIPLNKGADLNQALYDGEDFELLFTVSPKDGRRLMVQDQKFYLIGEIVAPKHGLQLINRRWKATRLPAEGFAHF